jgi:ABC-type lipoprotein export system ATPase subunit
MIRLESLSKYYYSGASVAVGLDRVSMEFHKGEFVAITGESGSGKSTLLRVLSGMDSFEEGEFYFEGAPTSYYDASDWEQYRKEHIGYVYQDYRLIDSYTALQNVECAMMINGVAKAERKKKALEYLKQVGLEKQKNKKASNLSSGQKQRLSIARALAKETDIIVADEPTGNLDSENGMAVMEILYHLSVDKLVIVVTHNYEQAEPYVTRKIRLFDGQVSEDEPVNPPCQEKGMVISPSKKVQESHKKTAWELVRYDWLARPKTTAFMALFLAVISLSFFLLLGGVFSNLDEATSKYYSSTIFANGDKTRLLVQKQDGSELTETDRDVFAKISHVVSSETYSAIGDIGVYYREDEDYTIAYRVRESVQSLPDSVYPELGTPACYLKSADSITDKLLVKGEVPTDYYEAAVSEGSGLAIGDSVPIYLYNENAWSEGGYIKVTVTITGIVKGDDPQFYLSEEYVKYLAVNDGSINHFFYYYFGEVSEFQNNKANIDQRGIQSVNSDADSWQSLLEDIKENGSGEYEDNDVNWAAQVLKAYDGTVSEDGTIDSVFQDALMSKYKYISDLQQITIVYNPDLTGNFVRLSTQFYDNAVIYTMVDSDTGALLQGYNPPSDRVTQYQIYPLAVLAWQPEQNSKTASGKLVNKNKVVTYVTDYTGTPESIGMTIDAVYNDDGTITPVESEQGQNTYEVSKEVFDQIFPSLTSTQMAVYIEDYAYTDQVLTALEDAGYEAVSVFRTGAMDYNMDEVQDILTTVAMCAVAFLVLFALGVLMQYTLWVVRSRDYVTLKLMGLNVASQKWMFRLNTLVSTFTAMVISIIILNILADCHVKVVYDFMKYYRWYHYLILILFHGLFALLTAAAMQHKMKKSEKA